MRLLMALVHVLLDVSFGLKLLLLVVHLRAIEGAVLVVRQEHMLIAGLPASRARLEEPMLLLDLINAIYLLSNDAVLAHAMVLRIVVGAASVFHVLAADNVVLLMRLVHHVVRVDCVLLELSLIHI